LITKSYSTSFYSASCLFSKEIRDAIFSIYAFVRIADEIVDTFHDFDKQNLIKNFEDNYNNALIQKISTNPILHAFQSTLIKYNIPDEFVRSFLASMKKDLTISEYNKREEIEEYIYGSADVVGLMCLKIFCNNNHQLYNTLELYAKHLGSAFQKVNFLRDLKNDVENLNRKYFNDFDKSNFDDNAKMK
jgi:15-cis-phytoene synthase